MVSRFVPGTLVWMDAEASEWKAERVEDHGALWIVVDYYEKHGSGKPSYHLKSLRNQHTCNAIPEGLYDHEPEEQADGDT